MKNFRHRVCHLQTSSPRARKAMFSAFGCCSVCKAAVAKRRRKGVSKPVTAPTEPACSLQGRRLHGASPLVPQPRGGSPPAASSPPTPQRGPLRGVPVTVRVPRVSPNRAWAGASGDRHINAGASPAARRRLGQHAVGGSTCPALLRNTQSRAGDPVNAGKSPDRTPRRRREPADREPARSRSASSPRKDTQASTTGAQRHAPRTAKSKRLTMTRAEKAAERVRGSHAAGGSFGARPL